MNLLFLTMVKINSLMERGIYTDLLRRFHKEGHEVFVACPTERRNKEFTHVDKDNRFTILNVQTFNLRNTSLLEKGLGLLSIEHLYLRAIKKYYNEINFDLILYSTPPITLANVIKYIRKRDGAYSYLLLKDIFPQNAVDMKLIKRNGLIHKYFSKKERNIS